MPETPVIDNTAAIAALDGRAANARTPEQLRALAAQFESLLLGQMLRDLRESMFENEDDKSSGFSAGPLADAMFSEMTLALSRAGGFGLGQSLIGPLTSEAGYTAALETSVMAPAEVALPLGVGVPSLTSPSALLAPMPGRLSSGYGWRQDPLGGQMKFHNGLDLALPVGQDVPAARNGEVSFAGEIPGYGLTVVVKHDDRMSTRYAHLSELLVEAGDEVGAGETIARSGATGRATGPHLHFEVLDGGRPVDPRTQW